MFFPAQAKFPAKPQDVAQSISLIARQETVGSQVRQRGHNPSNIGSKSDAVLRLGSHRRKLHADPRRCRRRAKPNSANPAIKMDHEVGSGMAAAKSCAVPVTPPGSPWPLT